MSDADQPIVIYATFETMENAKAVAHMIIKQHLGACVNILPNVISIFEWEGDVTEAAEVVVIVKSCHSREAKLIALIGKHHDYDEPAIISLPVVGGAATYLDWARDQVGC